VGAVGSAAQGSGAASIAAGLAEEARLAVPGEILGLLGSVHRVWVVPHERPDADALGAALGLQALLEQRGVEASVVSADAPPSVYDVIPTIDRVQVAPPAWNPDAVILVDCGDLRRTGRTGELVAALPGETPVAIIDHHASNSARNPLEWVEPTAAATCEMITLLGIALGCSLEGDPRLAATLAAGLIMDTATFQHGNTTPRTLRVGALLLAAGAPIAEISRRIYRSKPLAQVRLHARVLATMGTSDDGSTVHAVMRASDLAECGATAEQSEGIVDTLAQVVEADVALFVKEDGPGASRLSVRTKGDGPDATRIVAPFAGGGHARAAGASMPLGVDEALAAALAGVAALRAAR